MRRLHVLLLAYSISPVRGSEYSVGWNHVIEMSKTCDITVLYGLAGPHMGDFNDIEDYLQENGEIPNIRFIGVRPSFLAKLLNSPNRMGFWVYSFYFAYRIWHQQAAREARALLASDSYDIVHYLCPIGYREPGFLWELDAPYVWGPIGGMVPTKQLKGAKRSIISKIRVQLKNLANSLQLIQSRRVAAAFASTDMLVAATSENAEVIKSRFSRHVPVVPENAIPDSWVVSTGGEPQALVGSPVRLIWVGSMDVRKSPDLLIDALTLVSAKNWQLDLIGDGPLMATLRAMISSAGLDGQVKLHGLLSRDQVRSFMSRSDLHIITSMNEGNPTVIWEAMAAGVPTLSLEHCGMRDSLCETCGVLIPLSEYVGTSVSIAAKISELVLSPKALSLKKEGATVCADTHLWSKRSETWLNIYYEAIKIHRSKKMGPRT